MGPDLLASAASPALCHFDSIIDFVVCHLQAVPDPPESAIHARSSSCTRCASQSPFHNANAALLRHNPVTVLTRPSTRRSCPAVLASSRFLVGSILLELM